MKEERKNKPLNLEDIQLLTQELRKYFWAQTTLLNGVCDKATKKSAEDTIILLASGCSTATAIYELGEKPDYFYSEMMMLSRSLIEKLVNFNYLQIADESEYKKFFLHPHYRAFHNTEKSKHSATSKISIKYCDKDTLKTDPTMREALDTFSETNPKKDWSSLNVDRKISLISERTKIRTEFFLLNTLSIYSNASEALHGSLYGCALATGVYISEINSKNPDEVNLNLFKNTALLYAQLGSMIDETINFLAQESKIEEISNASKKNQEVCLSIMKVLYK